MAAEMLDKILEAEASAKERKNAALKQAECIIADAGKKAEKIVADAEKKAQDDAVAKLRKSNEDKEKLLRQKLDDAEIECQRMEKAASAKKDVCVKILVDRIFG